MSMPQWLQVVTSTLRFALPTMATCSPAVGLRAVASLPLVEHLGICGCLQPRLAAMVGIMHLRVEHRQRRRGRHGVAEMG